MYLNTSNHFNGGAKIGNHFTRITYLNDDDADSDSDSQSGGGACGEPITDYSVFKSAIEAKDKKKIGINITYNVSTGIDKHTVDVKINLNGIVSNGYVTNYIGNIAIPSSPFIFYSQLDEQIQIKIIKALDECEGGLVKCESHAKIKATMGSYAPVKINFKQGCILK